jgi:glutamate-1-semialdehyde 2,1-aminomutase
MALNRFFGRRKATDTTSQVDAADIADDETDDTPEHAGPPEDIAERRWSDRAVAVLPTGASTGSKRAAALYGEVDASPDADLPTHFVSASGCRVTDVSGAAFLDCTMALGSVALGYAEPSVVQAVIAAASEGNVSGLSSWREVELAERLCAMIPCAERVQFLKTGAEATAAAVRLARTYTGRSRVIGCGYFGWHDWSSEAAGVPQATRQALVRVPFDDMSALERAVDAAGSDLAAIVLEPVIERAPSEMWLMRARELCDSAGAALIFDEVKTGFRVAPGGYQEVSGVTPDLASFGKAMSNGFPLAAVVGKAPLMSAARDTWISSTLASESTALAAALAVLDWHDKADICATLAETGREMRAAVDRAILASGVGGVTTDGIDPMWLLRWDDPVMESRFIRRALEDGVLFKRGAYNFAAVAHDDDALQEIEAAASATLVAMMEENAG